MKGSASSGLTPLCIFLYTLEVLVVLLLRKVATLPLTLSVSPSVARPSPVGPRLLTGSGTGCPGWLGAGGGAA